MVQNGIHCKNILSDAAEKKLKKLNENQKRIFQKQAEDKLRETTIKWITLYEMNHLGFESIEVSKCFIL